MDQDEELAERFERQRPQLRPVAVRLLGSRTEADDAVQDAWLRASRADRSDVVNLGGWPTTIVAGVCLSQLQSRRARPEQPLDDDVPPPVAQSDPERDAVLADVVGGALLVVLDMLTSAERPAFVLHDLFAVPFDEVDRVLDRTPVAARQLASLARRRVAGARAGPSDPQRAAGGVRASLAASREGDFADLLVVLDPNVVLRANATAVLAAKAAAARGAPTPSPEVRSASAVAQVFSGRARAAQPALIDGLPGLVWAPGEDIRAVFDLLMSDRPGRRGPDAGRPAVLRELDIELL